MTKNKTEKIVFKQLKFKKFRNFQNILNLNQKIYKACLLNYIKSKQIFLVLFYFFFKFQIFF